MENNSEHFVPGFESLQRSQNSGFDQLNRCTTPVENNQLRVQKQHLDFLEQSGVDTNEGYDKIMRVVGGEKRGELPKEVAEYIEYASPPLSAMAGKLVFRGAVGFRENVQKFLSEMENADSVRAHHLLHNALHTSQIAFNQTLDSGLSSTTTVEDYASDFIASRHKSMQDDYPNRELYDLKFHIRIDPIQFPKGMMLDENYDFAYHEMQPSKGNLYALDGRIEQDHSGVWHVPIRAFSGRSGITQPLSQATDEQRSEVSSGSMIPETAAQPPLGDWVRNSSMANGFEWVPRTQGAESQAQGSISGYQTAQSGDYGNTSVVQQRQYYFPQSGGPDDYSASEYAEGTTPLNTVSYYSEQQTSEGSYVPGSTANPSSNTQSALTPYGSVPGYQQRDQSPTSAEAEEILTESRPPGSSSQQGRPRHSKPRSKSSGFGDLLFGRGAGGKRR